VYVGESGARVQRVADLDSELHHGIGRGGRGDQAMQLELDHALWAIPGYGAAQERQ
jgi:hypothetical protein